MSISHGPLRGLALLALAAAALAPAIPAFELPPQSATQHVFVDGHEAIDGEVLVKYREDRAGSMAAIVERFGADSVERVDRRGLMRMRARGARAKDLVDALRSDPDVEYAEPNYVWRVQAQPNDPSFTSLWGLLNTGVNPVGGGGMAGADIDAETAWNTTTGSRTNVIGVIDSGVDYNHPDLAANMWSAPSMFQVVIGGQTITCQAGTHGFDAIARTCNPMDSQTHGTHVSGTIGAVGNNGAGITGVNWVASMMGLKFLGSSGSGSTSDAVAAIEFAIQAKAAFAATNGANIRVLSNSWGGGGYSSALRDAIAAANSAGILFVAAAGNNSLNIDSQPSYPASYPVANIVAVASSTSSDQLSSFSNYGAATVHLAAPGSAILSTTPNNTYATYQGTSMATPHVSGAAALALAACTLTTAELKTLLLNSVDLRAAFATTTSTGGRLNVARALQNCQYPRVTNATLTSDKPSPQPPSTTVRWTASSIVGGEAPFQFQWAVFDGTAWTTVQDWSTANTFDWTPTVAGSTYQVAARVRSAWNSGAREFAAVQPFVVQRAVTSLSSVPNVSSPQPIGTTVTWTASASGGDAPYQYQWAVFDGTTWTTLTNWSTSNTFSWTPTSANVSYQIAARARSAWNSGNRELVTIQPYSIMPKVATLNVSSDLPSVQSPGTTITFTAAAGGGQAPYEYQWAVFDGTTWTTVTGWSSSPTYQWTPMVASTAYQIAARARGSWNTGAREMATIVPFSIAPIVTAASATPDLPSPQGLGTTISWTASASGGQAPYQYEWAIFDGATWTTVKPWSTSPTFSWTPTAAGGSFQVALRVRSAWNNGAREKVVLVPYVILPKVTNVTMSPNVAAPRMVNTTITWTATASGGQAPYEYQWAVFDGVIWTTVTGWSTSNTFAWTPTTANANYQVAARARSAWNSGTREMAVVQAFPIQ